jgi:thiol-disulfide isomerase/thioredoxin
MPLPRLSRNIALAVARLVAQNDLFEKPQERPRTAPLASSPAPTAASLLAAASAGAPGAVRSQPTRAATPAPRPSKKAPVAQEARVSEEPARPAEGCRPVDLAGLRRALTPNGKPLVVNHWASWCDPCVDELPRLVRAAAGVADVGEFLGLSWDLFDHPGNPAQVAERVAAFADSAGVGYASVLFTGEPAVLFKELSLDSELIPQTVVYAPDGTVAWKKNGVIEHDDVFPLIQAVKQAAGHK